MPRAAPRFCLEFLIHGDATYGDWGLWRGSRLGRGSGGRKHVSLVQDTFSGKDIQVDITNRQIFWFSIAV